MDRLFRMQTRNGWPETSIVMGLPPKTTVLLEVSGWKFYYGAATFRGNLRNPTLKLRAEPWSEFYEMHQEKAMADGAKWFCGHHAEICDLDGSGAVTGVVAKRADGKYLRFKARKGVALCPVISPGTADGHRYPG